MASGRPAGAAFVAILRVALNQATSFKRQTAESLPGGGMVLRLIFDLVVETCPQFEQRKTCSIDIVGIARYEFGPRPAHLDMVKRTDRRFGPLRVTV